MYRYFAYGSALSKRHIGEWAAEHGVDARLFARGVPAVQRGYRLVFDVESRFWAGRVADLTEDKSAEVHGVLFEIPPPARDAIHRKEGVPTGLSGRSTSPSRLRTARSRPRPSLPGPRSA